MGSVKHIELYYILMKKSLKLIKINLNKLFFVTFFFRLFSDS